MLICEKLELTQGTFQLSADVRFAERAITAVIGPSGAGKSTLLLAIAGFFAAQSGQVVLDDVSLMSVAPGNVRSVCCFRTIICFRILAFMKTLALGCGRTAIALRQRSGSVVGS